MKINSRSTHIQKAVYFSEKSRFSRWIPIESQIKWITPSTKPQHLPQHRALIAYRYGIIYFGRVWNSMAYESSTIVENDCFSSIHPIRRYTQCHTPCRYLLPEIQIQCYCLFSYYVLYCGHTSAFIVIPKMRKINNRKVFIMLFSCECLKYRYCYSDYTQPLIPITNSLRFAKAYLAFSLCDIFSPTH